MKILSKKEQARLIDENQRLRAELHHLARVVDAGDWYPKGDFAPGKQMMQILFVDADAALDRAQALLEELEEEVALPFFDDKG